MIYNQVIDEEILEDSRLSSKRNNKVLYRTIIISLLTLLLSPISLVGDVVPMSYVMLGVASVFNVPLLLIASFSIISMFFVSIEGTGIITFIFFFIIYSVITAALNINGLSKKYSVLMKMFIALLIIKMVQVLFMGYSFSSMLVLVFAVTTLYLVMVHGVNVILNIRKGYVFTEEEQISAMCVLALILSLFSSINIYNIYISNILAIMTVLIYGYRRGTISGCVSGFIMGLVMCIVTNHNTSFLVTLAAGGLISGLMNKTGKTIAVVGFIVGSALVSYFTSNFAYYSASIVEIAVAALPVLVLPKKAIKKIEEFFNFNNTLNEPYKNLLNSSSEAEDKLYAISDVLSEIADKNIVYTKEDKIELRGIIKKYILDYFEEGNLKGMSIKQNVDQEKINLCVDYVSSKLEHGDEIDEQMIIFDCQDKKELINNLKDVYNSVKIMRILKKKETEIYEKCNTEYKEISTIISNMAREVKNKLPIVNVKGIKAVREELKMLGYIVYEDDLIINNDYFEYTFITDILADIDKQKKEIVNAVSNVLGKPMVIRLLLNISKTEKSKIKLASVTKYSAETEAVQLSKEIEELNGDSHICMSFGNNKYISALSDGAGTGSVASTSSRSVVNTLEKLIKAGFDENKASEIVNKIIKLRQDESNFASLDIVLINLDTADARFIKFGAAPTYILSEGKVISINSMNLPVGVINDAEYVPIAKKLNNDDIVVQISDGVIFGENNIYDNYFTNVLSKIESNLSAKKIANRLLEEVKNNYSNVLDDVTIVVNKIKATKSIK